MKKISVAKDFSETPIGRYPEDDTFCGANFRDNLLAPALSSGEDLEVEIGGVEGYGSSFLDEAFGGLIRTGKFTSDYLKKHLIIKCSDQSLAIYVDVIWRYIREASLRINPA